jgi:hypothetical protein
MISLKDGTSLVGAREIKSYGSGFPIDVYDDSEGPIWLFGHEYGVTLVIRARSFETAWEIAIDEASTIDASEVAEAYGFDSQDELDAAVAKAEAEGDDWPELVEGYEMQSNCSGTGIVDVGHYAWLREMDRDDKATLRLVIRDDDTASEFVKFALRSYSYTMTVRGRSKSYPSYGLLSDVGARLRKLERAIGACNVETTWERG